MTRTDRAWEKLPSADPHNAQRTHGADTSSTSYFIGPHRRYHPDFTDFRDRHRAGAFTSYQLQGTSYVGRVRSLCGRTRWCHRLVQRAARPRDGRLGGRAVRYS